MANAPYDIARYQFVTGGFIWQSIDLLLVGMRGVPKFTPASMTLGDVFNQGAVAAGYSQQVFNNAVAPDGTVQAGPIVIPSVPVGSDITWFIMARRNATLLLSQLILYIDQAYELPVIANGLDVVVQPDWLANRGWFRA